MDPTRRAVITGLGMVSPLGIGADAHWAGFKAGRNPAQRLTLFDTAHCAAQHAAWVQDWQPRRWIPPHRLKRMERFSQFAVTAGRLALEHAGLAPTPRTTNPRAGISLGTALGGFAEGEAQHARFLAKGLAGISPSLGVQVFPASAHGHLAIEFGFTGPATTNTNSCAAGNAALGDALRMIQRGEADLVLAGAAEAPLSPLIYTAFDQLGAMSSWNAEDSTGAYRPWHRDRSGFVMGEGAAILVVESLAHARARDAVILAEITGYAITTEAHHMSTPEPSGEALQRAIQLALQDARLAPAAIDHVNAHASGTPANDVNELRQITAVLGETHARSIPICGTKPFTGHLLGAASAIEAATAVLAMQHGWVPPTLNLDQPDAAVAGYNLVPLVGQTRPLNHVLSIALGFGGIDTALVLSRVDASPT
jgi:3-oxoacyl-[acyl-carrier-protein] synthase II